MQPCIFAETPSRVDSPEIKIFFYFMYCFIITFPQFSASTLSIFIRIRLTVICCIFRHLISWELILNIQTVVFPVLVKQ